MARSHTKSTEFRGRYGRFSPDGRAYVITTPRTPRPWVNVISNGDYGLVISQTGGGYSWRTHAQLNRLTRWEQDLIKDEWGKYVYIRDERGNVWSAGWKPVCATPERYRCTHGVGYSVIEARNFDIDTELLVFVPVEQPMEIWRLTVRNRSHRTRQLETSSYFEWGLGQAPDWHREFHKSFVETAYDPALGALTATKRLWEVPTDRGHWNTDWPFVGFHAATPRPASFDSDKETFLGSYGTTGMPRGVGRKSLSRRTGRWVDPCASLRHRITLRPGEETVVIFTLGCADSPDHVRTMVEGFRSAEAVDTALENVQHRWSELLGTVDAQTPDPAMDLMENVWLKYQAISGRIWGRTAYYQTGGAFGFRDQLQDSQIWLPIDPGRTRQQLLLHARHQFGDGTVYHWWHPMSEIGLRNAISDNLLWLPFVTHSYLQETADWSLLDVPEPFVDDRTTKSLYDHCTLAIDRALERFSPRGLPLIGAGDWNDGLSAVGLDMKGESIWLGHFLHRILLDFSAITSRRGDDDRARRYVQRAAALREALNSLGWDGDYYYGATKDSGERIGSTTNREGRVWLNPQTWAVIGGVADPERARQVMDVVEERLDSVIGPLLLAPAYVTPDREVGYLTRYGPGVRENGGVYTHAATWAILAETILGRGSSAYAMYSKLNPIMRGKKPDVYRAEPYVTPGNIEGPDSEFFGRGGWTWYTGSAAWLFTVGLERILGVRPSTAGLIVDPCIPPQWKRYSVRRLFRGAEYVIEVLNSDRAECGVRSVLVDGAPACQEMGPREKTLPLFAAGTRHHVRVTLG